MNKLILLLALLAIAASAAWYYPLYPGQQVRFLVIPGYEGLVHFVSKDAGGCQVLEYVRTPGTNWKWTFYDDVYLPWNTYMGETGVMPMLQCSPMMGIVWASSSTKTIIYELYNPLVRYRRRYAPEE